MKQWKKAAALFLALLLMCGLMAGCGKKEESGTNSEQTGTNPTGEFDYSGKMDENGFWKDVTATSYITLPDYSSFTVPMEDVYPADSAIQAEIENLLASYAETVDVTDALQLGDTVNLDYAGYLDGVAFDGGTGNSPALVLGSGSMIPGFEESLVGHRVGESFDADVTFPETYKNNEALAGKAVVFHMTINSATRQVLPELTDEFVQTSLAGSKVNTAEEVEDAITSALLSANVQGWLENYMMENSTLTQEIPEPLMAYQRESMENYCRVYASYYGVDYETYILYMYGAESTEALHETLKADYEKEVKRTLVFQAISEKENLKASDDDLKNYFLNYYGTEDYSEYESFYGKPYLLSAILGDKVMELLQKNTKLE